MHDYKVNKKKAGLGVVLASLAWLVVPIASAQSDAAILASVRACQSITGLSERLACYDRVLPPGTGTVGTIGAAGTSGAVVAPRRTETIERGNSEVAREQELEATVAELEQQLEREIIDDVPTARIIEVQRPTIRTSRLIAEDGRVFLESVETSIIRWPEAPFDVEVSRSITGTYSIRAIGAANDRGSRRGYRVTLER
jgi:hypothetical protein